MSGRGWAITPKNDYAANWPDIARQVKDAADWRCVRCNHGHSREGWRILTVHHLDGDKANNAWWNLLALCQRCHLSVQGRVAPDRPYLLHHTPWFVPYVCGFYAHYYGGVAITRAEAEATPRALPRDGAAVVVRRRRMLRQLAVQFLRGCAYFVVSCDRRVRVW